MEDFKKKFTEYEREILNRGVSINELCRRAQIDSMTWRRLRAGKFAPRQDTLARITRAIEQIRREPVSPSRVKPKAKPKRKASAHKFAEAS